MNAYRKAIDCDPTNIVPWLNIGWTHLGQGDLNRSIDAFNQVLNIDPENKQALNGIESCERTAATNPSLERCPECHKYGVRRRTREYGGEIHTSRSCPHCEYHDDD